MQRVSVRRFTTKGRGLFLSLGNYMVSIDREPVVTHAKPAAGGVGGPSRMRWGVLPRGVSCNYFIG